LQKKLNLTDEQVAYAGDDLPDLPLIRRAGLGIAVANATPLVLKYADWITERRGGQCAVREICERLLAAQNHDEHIEARYR
jgi:3-deoxy-D-manno-octulosonate 8-phosphate phosphatase (KDO 8-P phosphatase)